MAGDELIFLKLGGSLITDKTAVESVRATRLERLAREISDVRRRRPEMRLVVGHGSGSFGHAAAATYGTRDGVHGAEQWMGFCQVSDAAARLNRIVCKALLDAGLPAVSLQPSASAICRDGAILELASDPVQVALDAGVVPLIYGDVAFDSQRGGTIISTEEVLAFLAKRLKPHLLLLAGDTDGVYDSNGSVIQHVSNANIAQLRDALGGSAGTDVTGGMASKVRGMLRLAESSQGLSIRIISGTRSGNLKKVLLEPDQAAGTLITA